jgi:hypothetical protein
LPTITPNSPATAPTSPNSTPITQANHISQLKTLEISPRKVPAVSTQNLPPARDPQEWKQPAIQVSKVMSGIFVACLGIGAVVKWVQAIDPVKMVNDRINNTKQQIETAIPNPFKSQPSVQQRQQDLSKSLQQKNIPAAKFYRQVDRAFYAKHPELNGRSLTSKPEDNQLRQEWQDLAVQMLPQQGR